MSHKLKVALIGCGGMGSMHNRALKALSEEMDIEMVAIADIREEFMEKGASEWPGVHTYYTGMELLENETPNLVYICLPSFLHAEHAIAAMRKGCHVFIEKPVCLTEEDSMRLLKTQEETGVKVMAGQVVRFFPEYQYLKKIYEDQSLGKLKSLVMHRLSGRVTWCYDNWFNDEEKSGSVVLDLHIHDLDFLRDMLGEPDSFDVKATAFESGMINQIIASYQFGDVFAVAEGIWDESPAVGFEPSFRACFEEGTVVHRGSKEPVLAVYQKNGDVAYPELNRKEMTDTSSGINISNLGPYYTEDKYFLTCLREDRRIERASLEEGVKSVLLGLKELNEARKYVKELRHGQ